MSKVPDTEWTDLKVATAAAFAGPVDDWLTLVEGHDPKSAMASLAVFLGHLLAGAAASLGVANEIDIAGTAGVIGDVMEEQIAAIHAPAPTGEALH